MLLLSGYLLCDKNSLKWILSVTWCLSCCVIDSRRSLTPINFPRYIVWFSYRQYTCRCRSSHVPWAYFVWRITESNGICCFSDSYFHDWNPNFICFILNLLTYIVYEKCTSRSTLKISFLVYFFLLWKIFAAVSDTAPSSIFCNGI